METVPCHCLGHRGTDCDWCQGSGFITEKVSIPIGKIKPLPEPPEPKKPTGNSENLYEYDGPTIQIETNQIHNYLNTRISVYRKNKLSSEEIETLQNSLDAYMKNTAEKIGTARTLKDEKKFRNDFEISKFLKNEFLNIKHNYKLKKDGNGAKKNLHKKKKPLKNNLPKQLPNLEQALSFFNAVGDTNSKMGIKKRFRKRGKKK